MRFRTFLLLGFLFIHSKASAQVRHILSGTVRDAATGEVLIGATVQVAGHAIGVTTNAYGFYSLSLPAGPHRLSVTFLGYRSLEQPVSLNTDQKADFSLEAVTQQMEEVTVTAEKPGDRVLNPEMGSTRLSFRTLRAVPAMLGEVDLVRTMQTLPGVTTVGEGSAGFNVRGGNVDQNLLLLDEAPVYNASHLMGFFSVFNPDAVKDVKLMKAGIPARYGGRLSSLMEVRMREGNSKRWAATGGIGTLSSRLLVEGPLVKDRGSVLVAGRRSYSDLVLHLSGNEDLKKNSVYFYDFSAKANYRIGARDQLFLSHYSGRDVFRVDFEGNKLNLRWGNRTGTLRWNHLFSNRLFANLTAVFSDYDYRIYIPAGVQDDAEIEISKGVQGANWTSRIASYNAKADFTFYANARNTVTFGTNFLQYRFDPGRLKAEGDRSTVHEIILPSQHAREYAVYLENEQTFGNKWAAQYGIRLSAFEYLGPGTVVDYPRTPSETGGPSGERRFEKGQVIASYLHPEPRLAVRFSPAAGRSLKASYNRTAQYIHLISPTTAASPLDIWSPSTNNIRPGLADQLSVGYYHTLSRWELSGEVYYKTLQNQIDYRPGAEVKVNPKLEAELLYGRGRSYGLEVYARRHTGRLTGWVSYTLSRSEQQVDGINTNRWYLTKFDRRHMLSIVGTWEAGKRLSVSATFTLNSGTPVTVPNARYEVEGGTISVPINTRNRRNTFRLPSYHRLDLSATWKNRPKPGRRRQAEWVASLYNVYGRRNPFSIYFQQGSNAQATEAVRLSIIGTVLPSLTYNFTF